MASVAVPVAEKDAVKVLTPAELAFNEKVKTSLRVPLSKLVATVESDMKLRQLPEKLKGDVKAWTLEVIQLELDPRGSCHIQS